MRIQPGRLAADWRKRVALAFNPVARFWAWPAGASDSPVKVTLRGDGARLEHTVGGQHDEGWWRQAAVFELESGIVERLIVDDGVDCDGRLTRHRSSYCTIDRLRAACNPYRPDVPFPAWTDAESGQRDYSAEAMGY